MQLSLDDAHKALVDLWPLLPPPGLPSKDWAPTHHRAVRELARLALTGALPFSPPDEGSE